MHHFSYIHLLIIFEIYLKISAYNLMSINYSIGNVLVGFLANTPVDRRWLLSIQIAISSNHYLSTDQDPALGFEAQHMEMMGLEPTTSALQRRRSPN